MKTKGKTKKGRSNLLKKKEFLRMAHAALDRVVEVGEIPVKRLKTWQHATMFQHLLAMMRGVYFIKVNVASRLGAHFAIKKAMKAANCGEGMYARDFNRIDWILPEVDVRMVECVMKPFAPSLLTMRNASSTLDVLSSDSWRSADVWEMLAFISENHKDVSVAQTIVCRAWARVDGRDRMLFLSCYKTGDGFVLLPILPLNGHITSNGGCLFLMVRD